MSNELDFIKMEYRCPVTVCGTVFQSAFDAYKFIATKRGFNVLSMMQANLLKFEQNENLAIMLLNLDDEALSIKDNELGIVLKNIRDIIQSETTELQEDILSASIKVSNDIISVQGQFGSSSFNLVDKRVACAFLQMDEKDFYYNPCEETTVEYRRKLLDEPTFVDILSDLQTFHFDDDEMLDYLSKDMVRFYLRDAGYSAASEALLYCGF